ncbi:MAG TPA: peroxiredoxin-like family protein [Polyangiales bacterium]
MSQPKESLHQIFRDLHAHRVATMDPAKLKVNIDQRKTLVETADPSKWVKPGDRVAAFSVPEVEGGRLTLDSLTARGPTVLIFFRFEGCPACNLALPYYQRNLWPGLKQLGATLVALSPQVPQKLVAIKQRHRLEFAVASDVDNELARRFGILYSFDEASRAQARENGTFIGDVTGTGTWELPQPTAVVIDREHVVRFADVHPDWLLRTEADQILDAVRSVLATPVQASATA